MYFVSDVEGNKITVTDTKDNVAIPLSPAEVQQYLKLTKIVGIDKKGVCHPFKFVFLGENKRYQGKTHSDLFKGGLTFDDRLREAEEEIAFNLEYYKTHDTLYNHIRKNYDPEISTQDILRKEESMMIWEIRRGDSTIYYDIVVDWR